MEKFKNWNTKVFGHFRPFIDDFAPCLTLIMSIRRDEAIGGGGVKWIEREHCQMNDFVLTPIFKQKIRVRDLLLKFCVLSTGCAQGCPLLPHRTWRAQFGILKKLRPKQSTNSLFSPIFRTFAHTYRFPQNVVPAYTCWLRVIHRDESIGGGGVKWNLREPCQVVEI